MFHLRSFFALIGILVAAQGCEQGSSPPDDTASASSTLPAAPTTTSAAVAARPVIDKGDLKSYPVLPAAFDSDTNPRSDAKVSLGRMLYYDKRLSKNHDVSCNSCHDLAGYGVDGKPLSPGHRGQLGGRNSPTVYNAGGHVAQFWDGRAADLEEQAKGPILNPVEMAMPSEAYVVKTLRSIPGYVDAFKAAFPGDANAVSYDNMAKAIGAFERGLVTPGRFDKWLAGDADALTDDEVRGFDKFIKLGCPTCHVGPAVGGTSFQKLGLVKPWPDQDDLGRFEVSKNEDDRMKFRVPSLRNVAKTAPYFHKGQVETLDQVVRFMAWHQLGVELTDEDAKLLLAFLHSLTGDIPKDYIREPELPESGPTTPKPDPTPTAT